MVWDKRLIVFLFNMAGDTTASLEKKDMRKMTLDE